jgi:serine/threonine protein kinase
MPQPRCPRRRNARLGAGFLLGKYGETLVVDWGLVKVVGPAMETHEPRASGTESTQDATQFGQALGTPAYMSPEQAAGRLSELGPASDASSLGATLYTVLTGKPPFTGSDSGSILQKVQRGEFLPPGQVCRAAPAALEAISLKVMALRPANRYPSPRALAEDVEHWLADEPVSAYREPLATRARRWMKRHRGLVMAGSTALPVGALSLGVATMQLSAKNDELQQANERETKLRHEEERDPDAPPGRLVWHAHGPYSPDRQPDRRQDGRRADRRESEEEWLPTPRVAHRAEDRGNQAASAGLNHAGDS